MALPTFKEFIRHNIRESVAHIEDLPLEDFIYAVSNLNSMIVTEKLDGTNLWFGIDDEGRFYTSREGKKRGNKRFFEVEDYPDTVGVNGAKAAHAFLQKYESTIKKIVKPGWVIEIEILYGKQPNAVVYGKDGYNYVAFIRSVVGGSKETIEKLKDELDGKSASVKSTAMDTDDGSELKSVSRETKWKFSSPTKFDAEKFNSSELKKQIEELKNFLEQENQQAIELTDGEVKTNFDVLKSAKRKISALKKDVVEKVVNDFKLSIKKQLLKRIEGVSSGLKDSKSDDDIGIEGVVFYDPKSSKQFKVVDRDLFTAINRFNYDVRNNMSGVVKTDDPLANRVSRGGLFGEAKIRIAKVFGITGLTTAAGAKKTLEKFKGKSPEETIRNIAASLNDFNWAGAQKKINSILDSSIEDIEKNLTDFKKNSKNYTLKLKNGKTVKYSEEIIKRTLLNFATTLSIAKETKKRVGTAKSTGELINAIFGQKIRSIHDGTADEDV